jgi:hypothetical protein
MKQDKKERIAIRMFYSSMFILAICSFFMITESYYINYAIALFFFSIGSLSVMGETMKMRYEKARKKGYLE